jgi:Ni/Co efflux regulator RcnB
MKPMLISVLLALSVGAPTLAPARAATITITSHDGYHYRDRRDWDDHDNGRHVGEYRGKHRGWHHARRYDASDCVIKTVRFWRHGHRVVKQTRTCS